MNRGKKEIRFININLNIEDTSIKVEDYNKIIQILRVHTNLAMNQSK